MEDASGRMQVAFLQVQCETVSLQSMGHGVEILQGTVGRGRQDEDVIQVADEPYGELPETSCHGC